jgi:hypothetical protein
MPGYTHSRCADKFPDFKFSKINNYKGLINIAPRGDKKMTDEEKEELIKVLKTENEQLKIQIAELEERGKRLKERISALMVAATSPRRGMPWK